MAKAIPVFKFAFAAYVASGAAAAMREQRGARANPPKIKPPAPFLQTWRVFSTDGGLMVKIGVRDDETCAAVCPQNGGADDCREIWLSEISETGSAFSGIVRGGPFALRHIRPGQRIGFDPTHILDWSIGCAAGDACDSSCALQPICEIAGS